MCGIIFGLSSLFNWSVDLFLFQCHAALITVALQCSHEVGKGLKGGRIGRVY